MSDPGAPGPSWLTDPGGYLQSVLGVPVSVTSGLRSPQHNAAVGGVPDSDHLNGTAFDFVPTGMSTADAYAKLMKSNAPIKQALDEDTHVHVAFDPSTTPPVDNLDAALAQQAGNSQPQQNSPTNPSTGTPDPLDSALAAQAARKSAPPPTQSLPRLGATSAQPVGVNWLDTALHYATGGLMDKGDAAVQALGIVPGGVQTGSFADRYLKNLTNIRGQYSGYAGANPNADYAARAAGVVAPILTGGLSAPTGLFGSAMKGAAMGGAYGFGSTNDSSVGDDLWATGKGAFFGGALGTAGHGIGAAAGAGTGAALDSLTGNTLPAGQRAAANTISAGLDQLKVPPLQLPQMMSGPKPTTLMDVGGASSPFARQGRMLTVLPGQPGQDVTDFLNARQQGQRGRVLGDIAQLAPNTDTYGTAADVTAARSADSSPLYQQAFAAPPNPTDRLTQLQSDPDIQQGFTTGLKIQRRLAMASGQPFDPNAYGITGFNDAGDPVVGPTPSWRTWHAGRMGLDDMIAQYRDPVTGALPQTQEVNSLVALRGGLDRALKSANPSLAAADQAWATPSQQLTAMNQGQGFLRADPEQITAAQSGMPPAALQAYQTGAGRSLRDIANDTRDNANIAARLNPDQMARDQLSAAFGPGPSQNFVGAMNAENAMTGTKNFVLGGSNTANKLADVAGGGAMPVINDIINGFAAGGPKGALVLPAIGIAKRSASNWAQNLLNNNAKNAALADLLTTPGPAAAQRVQNLLAAAQQRQRAISIGKSIGAMATRGTIAALSMLAPTPSQ